MKTLLWALGFGLTALCLFAPPVIGLVGWSLYWICAFWHANNRANRAEAALAHANKAIDHLAATVVASVRDALEAGLYVDPVERAAIEVELARYDRLMVAA